MEGALAIRALQLQAYAAAIDALRAAGNNNNQNTHALLQNLQTVFKISDVSFSCIVSKSQNLIIGSKIRRCCQKLLFTEPLLNLKNVLEYQNCSKLSRIFFQLYER